MPRRALEPVIMWSVIWFSIGLICGCTDGPSSETPCISAEHDARRRFELSDASASRVIVDTTRDFDGDGIGDATVSAEDYCGSGGCRYMLYVRRGSCFRFIGALDGDFELRATKHLGFFDLAAETRGGMSVWTEYTASFHGDGMYHVDRERTCRMVMGSSDSQQCTERAVVEE